MKNKIKQLFCEVIKYAGTSIFAFCIDLGAFSYLVTLTNVHYQWAVVISWFLGTQTNYLSCMTIFKHYKLTRFAVWRRHLLSSMGGLSVNVVALHIMVEWLIISQLIICKVVAIGLAFIFNFLFIKYYAFNNKLGI